MQKPTIKKMRSKKSKNASNKKIMRSKKTKKNNQRGGFPFGKSTKSTKSMRSNTPEVYRKFTDSAKNFSDLTEEDVYDDITGDMVKVFMDNYIIIRKNLTPYDKEDNIVYQNIKYILDFMIRKLLITDAAKQKIGSEVVVNMKDKDLEDINYNYGNNTKESQFNLMINSLEKNYYVLNTIMSDEELIIKNKKNLKKIMYLANALSSLLDKDPDTHILTSDKTMIDQRLV